VNGSVKSFKLNGEVTQVLEPNIGAEPRVHKQGILTEGTSSVQLISFY